MDSKVELTDKLIAGFEPPTKSTIIRDAGGRAPKGFGVRITPAGTRSFVLCYRPRRGAKAGKERRMVIGEAGLRGLSVAQARRIAQSLRFQIADGHDPLGERQADRQAVQVADATPTMVDLAMRYLKEWAEPRKRRRSVDEDRIMINQHILCTPSQRDREKGRPRHTIVLGDMKVSAVTKDDVTALHREITEQWKTPGRANLVLALLSKMFTLAIDWHMRTDNPVKGIERNPSHGRERYLDATLELPRLLAALEKLQDTGDGGVNAIRLLLATGSRRGETLNAKWSEFDLSNGVWIKPAANTKSGKVHRIPLDPNTIKLLRRMRQESDRGFERAKEFERRARRHKSQHSRAALLNRARLARAQHESLFLFPSARRPDQALQGLRMLWRRVCELAGLNDFRPHDLRHSYASLLLGEGHSLKTISVLLGHADVRTSDRYAHLADDVARSATTGVGKIIAAAGKRNGARVIGFRSRR